MRPKLQDVIERAWNEIANLPDGEQPKIHDNQLALELARYYEQDGHTAQQREDTLKADTWTLLCAYSFALREIPRYWKPEPIRTKKAYHIMALCMRLILDEIIALAFNMGLRLPQDTLKEYEKHELWLQEFKPFVAQLYGEISGDEASTPTTPQQSPEDGAEGQQPAGNMDEAESQSEASSLPQFTNSFSFEIALPLADLLKELVTSGMIIDITKDNFVIHIRSAYFLDIATSKVTAKRLVRFFGEYAKKRNEYRKTGAELMGVDVPSLSKGNGAKIDSILEEYKSLFNQKCHK